MNNAYNHKNILMCMKKNAAAYRRHCSVTQVTMYEEVSGLRYTPVRQNGDVGLKGPASFSKAGTVWYIITR